MRFPFGLQSEIKKRKKPMTSSSMSNVHDITSSLSIPSIAELASNPTPPTDNDPSPPTSPTSNTASKPSLTDHKVYVEIAAKWQQLLDRLYLQQNHRNQCSQQIQPNPNPNQFNLSNHHNATTTSTHSNGTSTFNHITSHSMDSGACSSTTNHLNLSPQADDPNTNTNSSHFAVDQDCNLDPEHCPSVQRLVFILSVYHQWCEWKQSDVDNLQRELSHFSMIQILEELPSYSPVHLYNDYCHLLDFHASQQVFWDFVHRQFTTCNLLKCKLFLRNNRAREQFRGRNERSSLFFGYTESVDVVGIQFLDRIHSYLLHSNINIAEEHKLYDHVLQNNEDQIERKLRKFRDFRMKRQRQLEKCQINLANNSKFVTEIEEEKEPNGPSTSPATAHRDVGGSHS